MGEGREDEMRIEEGGIEVLCFDDAAVENCENSK